MPLYQVPEDRLISTALTSKGYVKKLITQPKPTLQKFSRIIDDSLDSLKPSAKSKLIWTRMSALAGPGSLVMSAGDNQWIWDTANKLFQPEFAQIAIGGILRWRISGRDETWLLYVRDTGEVDPVTKKRITISEYWIDETYQPKGVVWPKGRPTKAPASSDDISKLKGAWKA